MVELTENQKEDRTSFLKYNFPDAYGYAMVFRPLTLVYAVILTGILILSHFFYTSVIELFIKMMMGLSILNILFIGIMIVVLDVQVRPLTVDETMKRKTPLRYKMSMMWGCSLCIAGIICLYLSHQYKKDYEFKCLDFYLEDATGICHIDKSCPYIGLDENDNPIGSGEGSWIKGHELDAWHTLCIACKERAEDAANGYGH